jgi:DNA (cytosine-5)-methyltransferase 1
MNTLSLFSGIGGMDLGLERAGFTIVAQCEKDPFCRRVLAKHWPGVPCHDDVTTLDPTAYGPLDAIVGGFPCQDVSNAGHRAGISGSRSGLYGELVRCLRVARPLVGILENVAALLARGMGTVLGDLAAIGYDAEWDCVPASACGALHHRDRVFITARIRSDTSSVRSQRIGTPTKGPWSWEQFAGLVQAEVRLSVPAGKSGGVADGVPGRVDRLRALGNAVVPQVATVIGLSAMEAA